MGQPSAAASNAVIYVTYGLFLIMGTGIAWRYRNQSKGEFLSGNRTQTAFPLALNFIASALGSGILFSYPELATIAGLQGVLVYALSSSLPLFIFAVLGPIIRRKTPEGFVLTAWTRQRYGTIAMLYLSFMTLVTLFLYMVAELSAIGQVVNALTNLDGLPVMIVQCVITTIYTSLGGFRISFLTDNLQGAMVVCLIIIVAVTMGVKTQIDTSLIETSGFLKPSLLGWQLLYILPICILTNDFFLSGFWLRTFASKTDKDLRIGVSIAVVIILVILTMVGVTGLVAAWSGALPLDQVAESGSVAFFLLLQQLPAWVVGIVLVMVCTLSTAAFDSLQSAMVSSASNDLFRNRLNIWWIRAGVVIVIIPTVVIALKAPSVLQIYLISDLVSASVIPVLVFGLFDRFYWWRGFEVVVGGLGGLLTVFIFGVIYYDGDVQKAGNLLILTEGLYANDWSAFGAFVAAPVGSFLWGFAALGCRLGFQYVVAKRSGRRFDALDRPDGPGFTDAGAAPQYVERDEYEATSDVEVVKPAGKFF
ncbi:putative urea active transporter 1-like protein 3 [Colletotrichum chlorophyti]|uniref:Putative urea active transporter 1-like protein 3 n=1 Tax=Colletotrichum chlorophyti TaxID=708187 RepID=A0A1Q8RPE1_9PEZI|nr:putative urea active transporter 1-like protein 3 [Colletotrichum chlorophyti]